MHRSYTASARQMVFSLITALQFVVCMSHLNEFSSPLCVSIIPSTHLKKMLQSTLNHEVRWLIPRTLSLYGSGSSLDDHQFIFSKSLAPLSLFPPMYFIQGEWQATVLNRIEWKRNPTTQKIKGQIMPFSHP